MTKYPVAVTQTDIKRRISTKTRKAIELMVQLGLNRPEAAQRAGLTDHALYTALRNPQARQLMMMQEQELRTSERFKTLHTLLELRDKSENDMVRLKAAERLLAEETNIVGKQTSPGVVLQIVEGRPLPPIDVTPAPEPEPQLPPGDGWFKHQSELHNPLEPEQDRADEPELP